MDQPAPTVYVYIAGQNDNYAEAIYALLSIDGFAPEKFVNPAALLDKLRGTRPGIVILDASADTDGFVADALDTRYPELPVMIMTETAGHDAAPSVVEKWTKPINAERFLSVVRSLLRGARTGSDAVGLFRD